MEVTGRVTPKQLGSNPAKLPLRRYLMRWLALFPLAGTALSVAFQVNGDEFGAISLAVACTVLWTGMAFFGPPREPLVDEALDEREELVRIRSHAVGGRMTVGIVMMGIGAIAWSTESGGWRPTGGLDWMILFFALSTVFACMPILHASWTTRPIKEEE